MDKFKDTEYVLFELKDGVLIGRYKKGLKINLEMAKKIVRERLRFAENKPYPTLACDLGVNSFDKEARDFLASEEGLEGVTAGAVVLKNSTVSSFLVNFYLAVAKPKIPTRTFTSEKTAMKWLQKFKN